MDIKKCEHCGDPAAVLVRIKFFESTEWNRKRYACMKHARVIEEEMVAEATPIVGFKELTTTIRIGFPYE